MSKIKVLIIGMVLALSLLIATPAARADDIYFDNGLNPSTGIGYVYQTRGPDQCTIVWWYDAYGNYGIAWTQ